METNKCIRRIIMQKESLQALQWILWKNHFLWDSMAKGKKKDKWERRKKTTEKSINVESKETQKSSIDA